MVLMNAQALMLPLMLEFVNCFTAPGFQHFQNFVMAHAALMGFRHCVTEVMRLTGIHRRLHWTTPYVFLKRGRWSCREVSQRLLELIAARLRIATEIIIALDDTLVKKSGKQFFGLGYYPDPTDKNPGAAKRRVLGHCWVTIALLWERRTGRWSCFPLAARLFVPTKACSRNFPFSTKIELAVRMIEQLRWPAKRLVLVADNLYAKAQLVQSIAANAAVTLISRLKNNARIYEPPPKPRPGKRGRKPKKGKQVAAAQLWKRKSKRRQLKVNIYGKAVTITAFVDILIASPTLGYLPILLIIFPQRSGKKMNVFFSTDITMEPERVLEIYSGRWRIEELFREVKTAGGFGDYRQRSFTAIKRHANLCLVASSCLSLLSLSIPQAHNIEAEPWWNPPGPPSITRLRRAFYKALRISPSFHSYLKPEKILPLKQAA
jgi:hypothetical protein